MYNKYNSGKYKNEIIMKIGIDARICNEPWYYSEFVKELIQALYKNTPEHEFVVYTQENLPCKRGNFLHDLKAKKVFEAWKFWLMIFFDHQVPRGYKWEYIILLENLKEVFFPKKKWLQRKLYAHTLVRSMNHAQKVIVLDGGSAMELNERLNIPDNKIEKIHGFFPQYHIPDEINLKLDIKTKYNIRGEYIIYDSGNEVHHNFERILKTLIKLKEKWTDLSLLVLCDDTAKDLDIRGKVIEYNIAPQIFFIGNVPAGEEAYYYRQSSGVIFSSIYESFPFQFSKAIAYECPIFANEIPANEHVMKKTITYLDPLSIHNMCDSILEALQKNKEVSYAHVLKKFSAKQSAEDLKNIIEAKD